ncbi:cytochrome C-552 [Sphingobium sp. Leaf26]|uniref:c-type cytochrome n=1 Tax=Sphingobium sp. Leaf26 TaxID=1735693 RepID=UPI0006F369A0|nr:cytochrome c [Sphingobium sp. Leaf26]KQN04949.1 cytochrome C-552 [Sphingobium sp. Leaf26]
MIQGIRRVTLSLLAVAVATASGVASAGGPQTFAGRCSMCHQPSGAGLPGQFPRLSGRVSEIATSPDGRRYLAMVLLYGIYGPIMVDDRKITGLMPGMGTLSDQDVADVLNHAVSLKKAAKAGAPFTAAEIAKVRAGGKMTAAQVAAERGRLAAKGLIR